MPSFVARRLSVDDVDATVAEFEPRLRVAAGDTAGAARYLKVSSLEDLHPDQLVAHVPELRRLLELGRKLDASPNDATALAELEALVGPEARPEPAAAATSGAPPQETADGTLERLLGRARGAGGGDDRAKQKVRELIDSALGSTQSATPSKRTTEGRSRIADLLAARCREILNDRQFRSVERAWRSAHWLASRLEDDRATVHVVDLPRAALAAHLAEYGQRLDTSPLHRLLTADPDGKWDMIVGDYSFDLDAGDLVHLAMIGALAARAGAPFLAHGDLGLVGCGDGADVDSPWTWRAADEELAALWTELRRHPAARWIALATPRFLLRQPYGAKTDPTERFAFEELPARPSTDRFAWANPAFACALLIAEAHANDGGAVWPSAASGDVTDLPMPVYRDGSGDAIRAPLELALGEQARAAIAEHGLVAFAGGRNTNRIAAGSVTSVTSD